MTQRERILSMLKAAGSRGIRSDAFFAARMPRAAARIQELKDAGEPITRESEGKFCRYFWGVGVGAGEGQRKTGAGRPNSPDRASVDSSESEAQLFSDPEPSSAYQRMQDSA